MAGELGPHATWLIRSRRIAPSSTVDVIVTAVAAPDPEALKELKALGMSVTTVAGRILAGDVAVGRLADVATASGVRYLEVAAPLWPEIAPRPRS